MNKGRSSTFKTVSIASTSLILAGAESTKERKKRMKTSRHTILGYGKDYYAHNLRAIFQNAFSCFPLYTQKSLPYSTIYITYYLIKCNLSVYTVPKVCLKFNYVSHFNVVNKGDLTHLDILPTQLLLNSLVSALATVYGGVFDNNVMRRLYKLYKRRMNTLYVQAFYQMFDTIDADRQYFAVVFIKLILKLRGIENESGRSNTRLNKVAMSVFAPNHADSDDFNELFVDGLCECDYSVYTIKTAEDMNLV